MVDAFVFPSYTVFKTCCAEGLSAIYPFTATRHPDPHGWKYGTRWPPSYHAFGTMRTLLAVRDALQALRGAQTRTALAEYTTGRSGHADRG